MNEESKFKDYNLMPGINCEPIQLFFIVERFEKFIKMEEGLKKVFYEASLLYSVRFFIRKYTELGEYEFNKEFDENTEDMPSMIYMEIFWFIRNNVDEFPELKFFEGLDYRKNKYHT